MLRFLYPINFLTKMAVRFLLLVAFAGLVLQPVMATTPLNDDQRKWSVETSLTFPVAQIYMLKASYRLNERVELGIGPAFQNWKNTDTSPLGQSHAWTLLLSYRYYIWRKFNIEIELWPAWNRFESTYDGNTYRGLELWAEYKAGWRFDLGNRLYLNLQPGIGHAIWMQNKWPDVEYDHYGEFITGSIIFVPQLMMGFKL
jgi:long-subunit fatty acid transport protein